VRYTTIRETCVSSLEMSESARERPGIVESRALNPVASFRSPRLVVNGEAAGGEGGRKQVSATTRNPPTIFCICSRTDEDQPETLPKRRVRDFHMRVEHYGRSKLSKPVRTRR